MQKKPDHRQVLIAEGFFYTLSSKMLMYQLPHTGEADVHYTFPYSVINVAP